MDDAGLHGLQFFDLSLELQDDGAEFGDLAGEFARIDGGGRWRGRIVELGRRGTGEEGESEGEGEERCSIPSWT